MDVGCSGTKKGDTKKSSHRRTPSIIGPPQQPVNSKMAKIAPTAAGGIEDSAVAPTGDENATIMGLIGGDEGQQLDIPIFKTEEGRYLATGTEYE